MPTRSKYAHSGLRKVWTGTCEVADVGLWRKTEAGLFLPDEVAGSWERVAKNRYVAHMDMLGMRQLTLRDPKLAWSAVSELPLARERRAQRLSYTINGRQTRIADHVATVMFSDTIFLFTRGDEAEDLRSILFACNEIFATLLSRGIPIRGGIAHGLFVFNHEEGLFVGPPLIEAYRLGEEAQWTGTVVHESVAAQVAKLDPPLHDANGNDVVVRWDVPLRTGTILQPVLAWPRSHRNNFEVTPPISVETFYQGFEPIFGPFDALRAEDRRKYENTVVFINAMLEKDAC